MESFHSNLLSLTLATLVVFFLLGSSNGHPPLKVGFYEKSCPGAESIVLKTVASYFSQDPTVTAPLLRLHFHDCFVRGCDGSVLINSTKTNLAEKDAMPNKSLDGFYVIDAAKEALERACPGTVSCADIVALVARDAVTLAAGKSKNLWEVQTGRRDGVVSLAWEALANIPSPFEDITQLKSQFGARGLNAKDLAILSGAHAIGRSHCNSFEKRLYDFTGKGDTDPTLDPAYAAELRTKCKPGDVTTTVEMVPGSSTSFDTKYYDLVTRRRGLFHSDEALLQDKESRDVVYSQSKAAESDFFYEFGVSMVRMGKVGVLTGSSGEIRRNCALVN
ncbi:peroxidase 27-like [Typha latifolia]|uniref:peroxidase 27-like n=1 Tax=Typha latifolia TaxID=4733 RepID=UPI003C2F3DC8